MKKQPQPWEGAHSEDMRLLLPAHFLMLCKLTNMDPQKVLHDFMSTLSMESFGKDNHAQQALENYFIHCGYGQDHYTIEDLHRIFSDLRAFGQLWPDGAKTKVIDKHSSWRSMYHKYWFKKWWKKYRRR
jgi:hypothetical protein